MGSRPKIIAACIFLALGAVLVVRGVGAFRVADPEVKRLTPPPAAATPPSSDSLTETSRPSREVSDFQRLNVAASHASMLASELPIRDSDLKASLADAVDTTLQSFLQPEVYEYLSLLESQGVSPVRPENADLLNVLWEQASRVVAGAQFDIEKMVIRNTRIDGKYEELSKPGSSRMILRDDTRRPFLATRGVSPPLQVECILPGQFTSQDGKSFDGVWTLEFTFNPEGDTWALTEMRVLGTPLGSPLSPLPI